MSSFVIALLTIGVYFLVQKAEEVLAQKYQKYTEGLLGFFVFSSLSIVLLVVVLYNQTFAFSFIFFLLITVWWMIRFGLDMKALKNAVNFRVYFHTVREFFVTLKASFKISRALNRRLVVRLLPAIAFISLSLILAPDLLLFAILLIAFVMYFATLLFIEGIYVRHEVMVDAEVERLSSSSMSEVDTFIISAEKTQ